MTPITKFISQVKERLSKATPWDINDHALASKQWSENKVNNAELCRHAYSDLEKAIKVIEVYEEAIKGVIEYCDVDQSHTPDCATKKGECVIHEHCVARQAQSKASEILEGK